MIQLLFYPLIAVVITFFLGTGVTNLFFPKSLSKYFLWLSPWAAIICVIVLLVTMSLFGINVNSAAPLIIFFLSSLTIYSVIKKRVKYSFSLENLLLAGMILGTIYLNLYPLIRNEQFLTSISLGNADIIAYVSTGDHLLHHSLLETLSIPKITHGGVTSLLWEDYRWGTPMLVSFYLFIFQLNGYEFVYALQTILFALIIPLTYILFLSVYKKSVIGLIFCFFLTAFNVNLLYTLYHVFFAQVLFWGLQLCFIILFINYLNTDKKKINGFNLYDLWSGIVIGTLYITYHEPIPFLLAPVVINILWRLISRDNIYSYFLLLLRILLVFFLIAHITVINNIFYIFQVLSAPQGQGIGWEPYRNINPYANPFEMFGFYSIYWSTPLPVIIAGLLSLAVIIILVYGLINSKSRNFLFLYVVISVLFLLRSLVGSNYFDYSRTFTYGLPVFIVLFAVGFHKLYMKFGAWILVSGLVLCLLLLISSKKLISVFIHNNYSVDKSFLTLERVKKHLSGKKTIIYTDNFINPGIPRWQEIWVKYFLKDKIVDYYPPVGFDWKKDIPENGLVLLSKKNTKYIPPKVLMEKIIWQNEYFIFGTVCNIDSCLLNSSEDLSQINIGNNNFEDSLFINGWANTEDNTRWTIGKKASLRLVVKPDQNYSKLILETLSLKEPQLLTLYIDGIKTGSQKVSTEWSKQTFMISDPLLPGIHNIKFVFSNVYKPSKELQSFDERDLAVRFKTIQLK